jgi:hypothetical protein
MEQVFIYACVFSGFDQFSSLLVSIRNQNLLTKALNTQENCDEKSNFGGFRLRSDDDSDGRRLRRFQLLS